MDDLLCPACRVPLARNLTPKGVVWHCEKCEGRAVALGLLRETFTAESINPIWLHALHHEGRAGRPCMSCTREMIDVPLSSETRVNVEVCQLCQMVWFDAGEIGALTARPLPPAPTAPMSQKVREAIAIAKVQALAEEARGSDFDRAAPDEWWKQIAGFFGF